MRFALITEGISENKIIEHIIYKYFKGYDPEINQIQPPKYMNKQSGIGGFQEVLKYCNESEKIKSALVENEYLIIQIDTDKAPEHPLNVDFLNSDNIKKEPQILYGEVVESLGKILKPEIMEQFRERILFAICINTIECWLLPVYYTNHHKSDTTSCLSSLNKALKKDNKPTISTTEKNNNNSRLAYDEILKNLRSRKDIDQSSKYNAGFQKFIESLKNIDNSMSE